jgi:fucose 4-O-acetylase-like acetyltransferase
MSRTRDVSIAYATVIPRDATVSSTAVVRDARIDAAKAVAIVLVVLGHAKGIPAWFATMVYSFHVPAFFVLSGWFAARRAGDDPRALVVKLTRTLLVPYAVFFFAAYAYWLLTRGIGEKAQRWGDVPWWDPLTGFASGIGPQLYVNPALWFLPAMFVTVLAYALLRRVLSPRTLALVSLAFALTWIALGSNGLFPQAGIRLPFALDVLPVALAFYAIGAAASGMQSPGRTPHAAGIAMVLLLLSWVVLAWANGRVDVVQLRFGVSGWMFFAAALLGTALLLRASATLAQVRALQWIGRNTLLILCTHMPVFFVLSGVASLAGLFANDKPGPAWALSVSLLALALCVPMRALLARWAPWALGLRASSIGGTT